MTRLARFLARFDFTVNVSGKKHDAIVAVGNLLGGRPERTLVAGHELKIGEHAPAAIIAYAGGNFMRSFSHSALGRYMKAHLKIGDRFVDAGANLGGYSLLARQYGAETILIEAAPGIADFLKDNTEIFGTVHACALSDEAGTANFFLSRKNIGGNSLVMSEKGWQFSGYSAEVQVPTERLDALITDNAPIKLLKIDVEGHEEAVVRGAEGLFAKNQVESVWCEVRGPSSDRNPNSYKEVIDLLAPHGFKPYTFTNGEARPFDPEGDVQQYFDLLFLRPEKAG